MKYLGRFMAILMVLLVIVTLPCATWVISAETLLLNGDTYKKVLAREQVYSDLIPALLPAIAESSNESAVQDEDTLTLLNIIGNLKEDDWKVIAAELIPAAWLKTEVETNLDAFFGWLNNETPTPEIAFDSASLRDRLSGAPGQRAVNQILQSWPPCTEEQIAILTGFQEGTGAPFPFCQPSGEYMASASAALSNALREQASQLPDVVPEPDWLQNNDTRIRLNELKQGVRTLQATGIELLLIPIALLSLMVFFTVRSLKSFGRWSGITLIFSGIAAVIPIPLLLSPLLLPSAITTLTGSETTVPAAARAGAQPSGYARFILEDIIRSIVGEFTLPVLVAAAVLIGLGFVALVVSAITRYPEDHPGTTTANAIPDSALLDPFTPVGQLTPVGNLRHAPDSTVTLPPDPTTGGAPIRSKSDPFSQDPWNDPT